MIILRKSAERGHANHGWLNSYHTFSFANYYDPNYMGFRHLRVINEDVVHPNMGFGTHPHRDMEIITYVISGALEHKDSMGNTSVIRPGEVQIMSAGTGITHSEYNPSSSELVHLLQIWILPDQKGVKPRYDQKEYTEAEKHNQLCLVVSKDGRDRSVTIHQDMNLYASLLDTGKAINYQLPSQKYAWIQLIKGDLLVNDQILTAGDGAAIADETELALIAKTNAEFLLFELA